MSSINIKCLQKIILLLLFLGITGCSNFRASVSTVYPTSRGSNEKYQEYLINKIKLVPSKTLTITPSKTPTITPSKTPKIALTITNGNTNIEPGLVILDNKTWNHVELLSGGRWPINFAFSESKDGTIWSLANVSEGLRIYKFSNNKWSEFNPYENPIFLGKRLLSIANDLDGTVLIGTDTNEIISYDGKVWKSQFVKNEKKRKIEIVSLIVRKKGEICAISKEDMSCKNNDDNWTVFPIDSPPNKKGWDSVNNAILSPSDDIWISMNNGWLYHYDGKSWGGNQIADWIGPISTNSKNEIWILTYENDSFFLEKKDKNGKSNIFEFFEYRWNCSPHNLLEAKDGTLWIGCLLEDGYQIIKFSNGVYKSTDDKILENNTNSNLLNKKYPFGLISGIYQSADGKIWFGTSSGIYIYHPN
jgi:hypothetical protein